MRSNATLFVDCRCFLGESITWWEPRRALLWTDIEASRIWMHDAEGTRHWPLPSRLGSLAPCRSGGLLLALEKGLYHAVFDDPSARNGIGLMPLADLEPDLPATRANDGRTDRSGNFVFGTMNQDKGRAPIGRFYQWSTRHGLRELDLPKVGVANSICFSPDGGTMYCCDSPRSEIWACRYDADTAAVSDLRTFARLGPGEGHPDGSIVDADGYLWNAAWGAGVVRRYRPDGTVEREVAVPPKHASCPALGGAGLNELYITTARENIPPEELERLPETGGVYRAVIDGVRGLPDTLFVD